MKPLTHTEENYLKAIFKANEVTRSLVNTNAIADRMNTSAASVTDMIKKLASKDLVHYEKYKGVKLTTEGSKEATLLIRKHRLWETFLVKKLSFSWEEVHDIAEELEHINSIKLINKLDEFLDYPKYDPHGDPIPSADGKFTIREQISLSQLQIEQTGILVGVKNHESNFLKHLNECNIQLGSKIYIKNKSSYDNSMVAIIDQSLEVLLSKEVNINLLVRIL